MRVLKSLLAAGLILFCSSAAFAQDGARIVTVNYALQYLTQRLVGDDGVEVIFPVPQDVDPSFWRPSIADISMIQSADLIVLNGAGFATWVDRVSLPRAKLVNTTAAIEDQLIVTKSITHAHGEGDTHSHEGVATYTWLDPTLAMAQAEAIAAALIRRKLGSAEELEARLSALKADLKALDVEAKEALSRLKDVPLIATHPRYQYFARRYGLSVVSLEWEAGALPTPEELATLKALAGETKATVLLWEAAPAQGAAEAIKALGIDGVIFVPLAKPDADRSFANVFSTAVQDISAAAASKIVNSR